MPTDVRLEEHAEKQYGKAPPAVQKKLAQLAKDLQRDPFLGERVPARTIPNKDALRKWAKRVGEVTNLYKLELPGAWRALYTVGSRGSERVVLLIEVLDHKEYDRVMGYA